MKILLLVLALIVVTSCGSQNVSQKQAQENKERAEQARLNRDRN